MITFLHDHCEHLEHLHPRFLHLLTPGVTVRQDGPDRVAEDRAHDVEVLLRNLILQMEQAERAECVRQRVNVINVGDHLVHHVHHKPSVLLQQIVEAIFIVRVTMMSMSLVLTPTLLIRSLQNNSLSTSL